jgi:hypothetical protein
MEYFIDHANYKDTEVYFPNAGLIPLKRGQHVFGTRKLSGFFGVDRQRIRTKLTKLKNIKFLTLRSTHLYSIATVINYDTYQLSESDANPLTNQDLTQSKPSPNPQLTTPNKDKKVNKEKNKRTSPADADLISKIDDISEELYRSGRFLKVHAFKNKMLKDEKNRGALYHALTQFRRSGKGDNVAWPYCTKIMQVESGNFNEAEYVKNAQKQQRELQEWEENL